MARTAVDVPRRSRRSPSAHRSAANSGSRDAAHWMVLGVLGILLSASLAAGAPVGVPRGVPSSQPAGLQSSGSSLCSTLTTNASLRELVNTTYPNTSLEPSEATANASIGQIWGTVCTSSTLDQVEAQSVNVSFQSSVYIGDSNGSNGLVTSGSLFVRFSVRWVTTCPAGSANYPTGFLCRYSDTWTGNLTTAAIIGPVVSILSVRYAGCTLLEANASLVVAMHDYYPNAALHPTEAVAEQTIQIVWGEICSSMPFYQAQVAHPGLSLGLSGEVSGGGADPNRTTSPNQTLFILFDFNWQVVCPSGPPAYPAGVDCSYDESWSANLATGNWTGPTTSVRPVIGHGGLPAPLGHPPSSNVGLTTYLLLLLGAAVGLGVAGLVFAWSRPKGREPPPGSTVFDPTMTPAPTSPRPGPSSGPEEVHWARTGPETSPDSDPGDPRGS
jgi:hypothetical protein